MAQKKEAQANPTPGVVGIALAGICNTGKTTVANILLGKEVSSEYNSTNEEKEYDTQFTMQGTPYNFKIYDAPGSHYEDCRSTAASGMIFGKCRIHIYCANREDSGSVEAIEGYFKDFAGEMTLQPYSRIIILNHKDQPEEEAETLKKVKEFAGDDTRVAEYNLMDAKEREECKKLIMDQITRLTYEKPELFDGCKADAGKAKKEEKKPADTKGGNKPAKQSSGKKKCCIQ